MRPRPRTIAVIITTIVAGVVLVAAQVATQDARLNLKLTSALAALRYVNIALAVVILVAQAWTLRRIWRHVAADVRLKTLALILFAIAGGYGSAESIAMHVPPAPRTFITTVALAYAALASCVPDRYRQIPLKGRRRAHG